MHLTKKMSPAQKITTSGVVIALYVVIMLITESFAFGQYQIRMATSLYALSAIYPFLILPLGIANFLSNIIMGGLGPLDAIGGFFAGILTTTAVYLIKKAGLKNVFIALPIILIPGLLVPVWLSYLLNLPYKVLAVSLVIGQIIPGFIGYLLCKLLSNKIK